MGERGSGGHAGAVEKANFDDVYDRDDPRAYFRAIAPLGYQIPEHACAVFRELLPAVDERSAAVPTVLDICCSYGVNAALLRCDVTLVELFERYEDPALARLSAEELAAADRAFYADRLRPDPPRVLGLDAAQHAVAYARAVDLLAAGWGEDLESHEPSPGLVEEVSGVDLVTITGGVGYITERTVARVMRSFPRDRAPWVASFVLRVYPYDDIAATLAEHGLVTERLEERTFRQRRFESEAEQDDALRAVRARGLDPTGKEDQGWYHCDLYVSRPASAATRPLGELLTGSG